MPSRLAPCAWPLPILGRTWPPIHGWARFLVAGYPECVTNNDDVTSDAFYDTRTVLEEAAPGDQAAPTEEAGEPEEPWIRPEDVPGVRHALIAYRVMAYVVGTLLIVLVCIAMPLKYAAGQPQMVNVVGVTHGWLYAVLLITAYVLGRRADWPIIRVVIIALAGTVPFLSFVAEYYARKDVNRRIASAQEYWAAHPVD